MSLTTQGYITSIIFGAIIVAMTWIAIVQRQQKSNRVYEVILENGEVAKWSLPGDYAKGDIVHLQRDGKRIKAIIR